MEKLIFPETDIYHTNISEAMSLRDRAEVTEVVFFQKTAVDGRRSTDGGRRTADGGRRTAVGEVSLFISVSLSSFLSLSLIFLTFPILKTIGE